MPESNHSMTGSDVLSLYDACEKDGVKLWVDGGWSVDALLGEETCSHQDLDIAIQWKDVSKLRQMLEAQGYAEVREDSKWNFVLGDQSGHEVDVHAFIYDDQGNVVEGIMYPAESLTGVGTINGRPVRCIAAKYMVEFLAPWIHKHPHKYVAAVAALCQKFGIELPQEYRSYQQGAK